MTSTPLENLLSVLDLAAQPSEESTFTAPSLYFPTGRVYGGQVLAQSVMAASLTTPDRLPHSLHGYFISPGDIHQDVTFHVENLRDGRSFSSRRVNVTQSHGAILTAIASFQEPGQSGFEYADVMPENVPDPEELPSAQQLMTPLAQHSPFADYYAHKSAFDIRHVTPSVILGAPQTGEPSGRQLVWMKLDGTAPSADTLAGQTLHRALLALGCDQIMMEPIVRRAQLDFSAPGMSFASLDHSMWWYQNVDMNTWHLYVQDTPVAAHGRGLAHARVYSASGELVAAMAQEAMIRVPAQA
ncbi:acyl-CoA thioesterase [Alloscardovia macacae]|uniref:Acyl-CoA thioesterase II n=1 Tax=Alloscardovia macacae TaxID=1160091 RepID=A0A261F7J9_9BIFI|nr:acyl-CoA thioesterase domain-containing protein [Alloscardovia macacae]OZG55068.1 acyl-CoA thioesterase II [Alloscardovia macacae]